MNLGRTLLLILIAIMLSTLFSTCAFGEDIVITKDNTVVLRTAVDGESMSKLTREILTHPSKKLNLYISSPGGSVFAGMKFINTLKASGKEVTCVVDFAASMAFVITQACTERMILIDGVLMQHPSSIGLPQQPTPNLMSFLKLVEKIGDSMEELQTKRIGISKEKFEEAYRHDLWLFGKDAVKFNAADRVVTATCTAEAVKETEVQIFRTMFGEIRVTWSKCALISEPLDISMNGQGDTSFLSKLNWDSKFIKNINKL